MARLYNVLVIEDHPDQLEILKNIVDKTGICQTFLAANGREAQEIITRRQRWFGMLGNDIDCIFLDFQMPEMSGEIFLEWLRTHENRHFFRRRTPVVIVSAYEDHSRIDAAKHIEHGQVSGYITKPYEPDQIRDMIIQILIQKSADPMRESFRESISHDRSLNNPVTLREKIHKTQSYLESLRKRLIN